MEWALNKHINQGTVIPPQCQQGVRHFSSTGPQPFSHAQPTGIPQKQETARSYKPPITALCTKAQGKEEEMWLMICVCC